MMAWDIEHVKRDLSGPAALVMVAFNDCLSLNLGALKSNIGSDGDLAVLTKDHALLPR